MNHKEIGRSSNDPTPGVATHNSEGSHPTGASSGQGGVGAPHLPQSLKDEPQKYMAENTSGVDI